MEIQNPKKGEKNQFESQNVKCKVEKFKKM